MKRLGYSVVAVVVCVWALVVPITAQCDSEGDVGFVCGPISPEDLYAIPNSPWVIVSSMIDGGNLYTVDTRDYSSSVLFPTAASSPQLDTDIYGRCPGPVTREFRPHGINLREGASGLHTLYVVGHGARESVEVFEVDARVETPTATWVGCVIAPDGTGLNSVAVLPDGGFVATNFQRPEGELWEWQPASGWTSVPGSMTNGPNGVEASPDGQWLFIGGWGTQSLIRISRGRIPVEVDSVDVGFHVDNVRFAPDGSLLAAGHIGPTPDSIFSCFQERQCDGVGSSVARVNALTLAVEDLVIGYPPSDTFILGTVALEVGEELWVGAIGGGDRILRLPAATLPR